jgi:hypothetical protein
LRRPLRTADPSGPFAQKPKLEPLNSGGKNTLNGSSP